MLRRVLHDISFLRGRGVRRRSSGSRMKLVPLGVDNPLAPSSFPEKDAKSGWSNKSRRTGLLAMKVGMYHEFNNWGQFVPLTVLQVQNCVVLQVKTEKTEGYNSIQLGAGPLWDSQTSPLGWRIPSKPLAIHNVPKSLAGHFAKADVPPKRWIQEFRVTPDAIIPVGTELLARHFTPGQLVDVSGLTIGKGFQGAMKRWGFGGLPATHGVSLTHRSLGATGARTEPGRVWKGKKMSGRMGNEKVTIKSLTVHSIDSKYNLVIVKGAVPGPIGGIIRVTDAISNRFAEPPAFPTWTVEQQNQLTQEQLVFTYKYPRPHPKEWEDDKGPSDEQWFNMINSKVKKWPEGSTQNTK